MLLALLNVIIRLPISNHAYSTTDSFFIQALATSISTYGHAKWILHPLSFIGVYPLSYASMYPFFLSGLSALTGATIERTVLLSNIMMSLFGMFSIYLVAKEVKKDDFFAFWVSFAFSISPVFFTYTNWAATARSPFIALLPFFIYLLLKSHKKIRYATLSLIFLSLLVTVHQMFYMTLPIIAAYLISLCFSIFRIDGNRAPQIEYVKSLYEKHYNIYNFILFFAILFTLLFIQKDTFVDKFSDSSLDSSLISTTTTNVDFFDSIRNLLISYTGKLGLNLFFGFLGIIYILQIKKLSFKNRFFLFSILIFIFGIRYRYYTPLCYLTLFVIFIGYGIEMTFFKMSLCKKTSFIFVTLIFVSSISFSIYMDSHWKEIQTNRAMTDETYNTAQFVNEKTNGTLVVNEGNMGQQIEAISGKPVLPFDIVLWYSPQQLIYDFEDKNNLNPVSIPIGNLLSLPDTWYTFNASNVKKDYQSIMYSPIDSKDAQTNLLKYKIKKCVLYKPLENYFNSYGNRYSEFIPSMVEKENKIYDSNTESIWYFNEMQ